LFFELLVDDHMPANDDDDDDDDDDDILNILFKKL
jgi:hypothetical protein